MSGTAPGLCRLRSDYEKDGSLKFFLAFDERSVGGEPSESPGWTDGVGCLSLLTARVMLRVSALRSE